MKVPLDRSGARVVVGDRVRNSYVSGSFGAVAVEEHYGRVEKILEDSILVIHKGCRVRVPSGCSAAGYYLASKWEVLR